MYAPVSMYMYYRTISLYVHVRLSLYVDKRHSLYVDVRISLYTPHGLCVDVLQDNQSLCRCTTRQSVPMQMYASADVLQDN